MKYFIALLTFITLNASAQNGSIDIYDAKLRYKLVLQDGQEVVKRVPPEAHKVYENLLKTKEYYLTKFGRNSWDNRGSHLDIAVNINQYLPFDLTGKKYNTTAGFGRIMFGAGTKNKLNNFEKALDVVAHEYTHLVIQSSSNLDYAGESGALNEHLSDVFGTLINIHYNNPANPFLHGESILSGKLAKEYEALRNLLHPSRGYPSQPEHMKELETSEFSYLVEDCEPAAWNDNCGVHIMSGIPNRMAALVIKELGTEASAHLFYNVMTKRLKFNSNFRDYEKALLEECMGISADACEVVLNALTEVGIHGN